MIIPSLFLDTVITRETDGTFTIGVYRKPTHTDLYLPWDSRHNLSAEYSVIKTLTHRAHSICSTLQLLKRELHHLEEVFGLCKYPKWAIKNIFQQQQEKKRSEKKKQAPTSKYPARKCHILIPYVQGICESLKNMCGKHGVTVYFKGQQTLKNILMSPKDKDSMVNKNSDIDIYCCGRIDLMRSKKESQQGHLVKDLKNV